MASKCPHCGRQLKWYNIKADCPDCGISIPNYNWEARLEEDNIKAEEMWKAFVENISITERENRKLQRNNIPLHFRTYLPEFQIREGEKET